MNALHVDQHILLIGWNGQRTMQLLNLLMREQADTSNKPAIVLCVKADIENPMPGKIEFVKVASFNQDEDMNRACVEDASVIIMDNPEDDMTMTTALYCSKRNPNGHLLAYFKDESLVSLLQQHCPNVECTPSVAIELLAKSAFDPGSSTLHHDLLDATAGQAQYSSSLPDGMKITAEALFSMLKAKYDATFIGYMDKGKVVLNPPSSTQINSNSKIYYIARKRLVDIDWSSLTGGTHV